MLTHPSTLDEIRKELEFQLTDIPSYWDPHKKLDYVKMSIRSTMSLISGRKNKQDQHDQTAIINQINTLKIAKENLLILNQFSQTRMAEIDIAITNLELDLKKFLDDKAKFLILRSGTKWYEEGKRSNAYFLNIINKR